jgi:hypothetical protein
MLFDFLVVRQMVSSHPAHAVRGPKYVVKKGRTPVWSRKDAKTLLDLRFLHDDLTQRSGFGRFG